MFFPPRGSICPRSNSGGEPEVNRDKPNGCFYVFHGMQRHQSQAANDHRFGFHGSRFVLFWSRTRGPRGRFGSRFEEGNCPPLSKATRPAKTPQRIASPVISITKALR